MASKILILAAIIAIAAAATVNRHDPRSQSSWDQRDQQATSQDHQRDNDSTDNTNNETNSNNNNNNNNNENNDSTTSAEQHSEPDYSYSYAIRDDWSGDRKSQHESRQGDRVQGQYRMMEADGTERIVDYTADDWNGFNAVVRHEPQEWRHHTVPIQVAVAVPIEAIEVHAVEQLHHHDNQQQQQNRQQTQRSEDQVATSNMHIAHHNAPGTWMISSHIRHN